MNFLHSTVHTPIDYLSYLGSDISVSFMVLEITSLPVGTLSVTTLSVYLYTCIHVIHKSKAWVYRAPSEVTRNSPNLELRDCYHRIRRQILLKNAGITFPLAQNLEIQFFGLLGVN